MSDASSPDELRTLAFDLICALEDSSIGERIRRLGVEMVRRSYGQGRTRVEIVRQADLGTLTSVPDTFLKEGIGKLIEHKIVQAYPGTDFYEVLAKPAEWKVGARCRLGFDGAADLRTEIDERNGPPEEQIGFDQREDTFATDLIRRTIGENSREDAARAARRDPSLAAAAESTSGSTRSHRSPQPGEGRERFHNHPSGIIRAGGGAAGESISFLEAARRSLQGEKVTAEVTLADGTVLQPAQTPLPTCAKVTGEVTSPGHGAEGQRPKVTGEVTFGSETGQKLPQRKLSPASCASDDHLSSVHLHHLSQKEPQLSSSDDQIRDERRADERCGVVVWQMVAMQDELLGDVRRSLGEWMGGFTWYWREAIWGARACVYEALAAFKCNQPEKHPGGYLRECFLEEAHKRKIELPPKLLPRGRRKGGGC